MMHTPETHARNTFAPFSVWEVPVSDDKCVKQITVVPDSDSANLATAINIVDRQLHTNFTEFRIFDNVNLRWVS